jgi:hypothetical protein
MHCFNVTDQRVEGMERGRKGIKGRMWYGIKIQNKCFPIEFQWLFNTNRSTVCNKLIYS